MNPYTHKHKTHVHINTCTHKHTHCTHTQTHATHLCLLTWRQTTRRHQFQGPLRWNAGCAFIWHRHLNAAHINFACICQMEFSTQSIAVSLEQNLLKFCPTKVPSDPNVPAYKTAQAFYPNSGSLEEPYAAWDGISSLWQRKTLISTFAKSVMTGRAYLQNKLCLGVSKLFKRV